MADLLKGLRVANINDVDKLTATDVKRKRVSPLATAGHMGARVIGGIIDDPEVSALLRDDRKYQTYSDLLANVSIVASGVRYFANLATNPAWSFEPSENDRDGRFAEMTEKALMYDNSTTWSRVVRRAIMYRFYGFSLQEWTMKRAEDGSFTYAHLDPRAQRTIEEWDVDVHGVVKGAVQRSPNTLREIYLPRGKCLYLVDDTLNDSPEGLGLFRHLVEPCQRLRRYEQLEGFGFETDLRGVPLGRAPLGKLAEQVKAEELTEQQVDQLLAPIENFIENHVRTHKTGMLIDSEPYSTSDDANRPSNVQQWGLELLKSSTTSLEAQHRAIMRVNREIARIMNVEQLLLGEDGGGSYAMLRDKTNALFLLVDAAMKEINSSVHDDLVVRLFEINGWPMEMMPQTKTAAVRFQDVEQMTEALRGMAQAGAILAPDDPAIDEVRDLIGLSPSSSVGDAAALDAALVGGAGEEDEDVIANDDTRIEQGYKPRREKR